jgi:hypothetical protein
MKLAIMQPYLIPYIGYFQLINAVDKFILFDDVNFINKGWINRNNILLGGKAHLITLPLKDASQNKKINEIEWTGDKKVIEKLCRTIEQAYKKAPYFEVVYQLFRTIMMSKVYNIAQLNFLQLQGICNYLGITTQFGYASQLNNAPVATGQQRILNICLQHNTNTYINAIGGMELYAPEIFKEQGIQLQFIQSKPITYKQWGDSFVPSLSILDVLMFNDTTEIKKMLNEFTLI